MKTIAKAQVDEERFAKDTLIRLANSCERAAARGTAVVPLAHDLDTQDYATIAEVLHGLADTLPD
jgi:hypothetical protein